MHENDNSAHVMNGLTCMTYGTHTFSWESGEYTISCMEFSSMETFGYYSMHEKFGLMHGNFNFMHGNFSFMHENENVMHEILCRDFLMHETFQTGRKVSREVFHNLYAL